MSSASTASAQTARAPRPPLRTSLENLLRSTLPSLRIAAFLSRRSSFCAAVRFLVFPRVPTLRHRLPFCSSTDTPVRHVFFGADKEHVEHGAGPAAKCAYLVQVNAGASHSRNTCAIPCSIVAELMHADCCIACNRRQVEKRRSVGSAAFRHLHLRRLSGRDVGHQGKSRELCLQRNQSRDLPLNR